LGWDLPQGLTLPGDVERDLDKLGLSGDDFLREWIPLVDNISWFLRKGGEIESVYDDYKRKVERLKTLMGR